MRSVLHQTKARAAKLEPSRHLSSGHSITAAVSSPGQGMLESMSLAPVNSKDTHLDAKELNKKQTPEIITAQPTHHLPPRSPAQIQMQLQHELQQQAAFFQPQFLNPAFLPHFPMTPEALLQFQQPQFLFPFYIPGAEFSLGPDLALPSSTTFGMPGMTTGMAGSLLEDLKQQIQTQHHVGQTQLQLLQQQAQQYQAAQPQLQPPNQQPPPPPQQQPQQPPSKLLKQEQGSLANSDCQLMKDAPSYKEAEEMTEKEEKPKQESTNDTDGLKDSKDVKKQKSLEPCIPPPRIASGARGNAAKALLENFGFELVIQYNENRQKVQKKGKSGEGENSEKLECGTCGKLF